MAQKVTESVKGMDQGMETVAEVGLERAGAEVGKGLDGSPFKSSVSGGKSGSAEVDEKAGSVGLNPSDAAEVHDPVAGSALGGAVGSESKVSGKSVDSVSGGSGNSVGSDASVGADDTEDTDLLDFDDMDSGELTDMENTGVLVYREKFISKERRQKYWGYFVVGMLRGRKVRVSLVSTDAGGYDLLDIVFNGADSVELWRKPYSMKDEKGKITASGFTYSVVSLDEDETVYTAQVKPSRKSDKALLEKIIELSMRSIAREEE